MLGKTIFLDAGIAHFFAGGGRERSVQKVALLLIEEEFENYVICAKMRFGEKRITVVEIGGRFYEIWGRFDVTVTITLVSAITATTKVFFQIWCPKS